MPEDLLLQTVSKSGQAPKTRIRDVQAASEIVENLYQSNERRRLKWAQVDRMFDGTPPYDPQVLLNNGQAWRSNVPTMSGKAILSNASTTYYDLLSASDTFFEIKLDLADKNRGIELSRAITTLVDKKLKKWPDFFNRMWAMINDYVRHGRGFLCWKGDDWKFTNIAQSRVMVPDATNIDLETVDLIIMTQEVQPTWLWKKIKDVKESEKIGWNRSMVIQAIGNAMPPETQNSDDLVEIEKSLNDNDMWFDSLAEKINLAHIYVKEFSGNWSYYIIERFGNSEVQQEDGSDFLYKSSEEFEHVEYFLTPFFFEVMSGSWNGTSGLGKDIHPLVKNQDRLQNAIMDSVYLRTGINLQAQDASSLRRLSSVQIGGAVNIFPPGFNALNGSILGDIDGALAVDRQLNIMLERNTGVYRPSMQSEKGNPKTATETQLRFAQATILTNSAVDRWYVQEDRLGQEIWRRMKLDDDLINEIKKATGATKSEIKSDSTVTASRSVGNGSQVARQQSVSGMTPIVGSLPEQGRQNWLDDFIAVVANPSKVERWNPKPPERDKPTQQQWEAMEENGTLASGAPVIRYSTQNDLIHAQTHLQFMSASAAALQNGADPSQVLKVLNNVGPHTQVHIAAMSEDSIRQNAVKALEKQLKDLSKTADQLSKLVQQQAEESAQNQPEQQLDPKAQADMDERVAKFQLESQTQQAKLALEKQKTDAEIENMNRKAKADIDARLAQAQAQIVQDRATPDN